MFGEKIINAHIWKRVDIFPLSKYTFGFSFPERYTVTIYS